MRFEQFTSPSDQGAQYDLTIIFLFFEIYNVPLIMSLTFFWKLQDQNRQGLEAFFSSFVSPDTNNQDFVKLFLIDKKYRENLSSLLDPVSKICTCFEINQNYMELNFCINKRDHNQGKTDENRVPLTPKLNIL